jgi:hypothetical protein
LWIDIDPDLIHPDDKIELSEDVEKEYGLRLTESETNKSTLLYEPLILSYANGNMWAMRELFNISKKLRTGYVQLIIYLIFISKVMVIWKSKMMKMKM